MRPQSASLLLAALLASSVTAQIGIGRSYTENLPGDGVLPPGAINIYQIALAAFGDDGTGLTHIWGAARLPNGHYIVSHGEHNALSYEAKQFFELDTNGNWVGAIEQPFNQNLDRGLTDLAWDGETDANSRLWAGRARGIMSFDWQAQAFDQSFVSGSEYGLKVLEDYHGEVCMSAAIAEIGGQKIFISADNIIAANNSAGRKHSETNYHLIGQPMDTSPMWKAPTSFAAEPLDRSDFGRMGAAYDATRDTIWWATDAHSSNPNPNHSALRFIEMDLDGSLTGQVIQGSREIAGVARGCEMYIDANGNQVMVYAVDMASGSFNPLGISNDQDILVEMYMGFEYGTGCGGDIAFMTEPYIGNLGWAVTLENAPGNPLGSAFLARGIATDSGLTYPGITDCALLIDLGGLRIESPVSLVNGEASFIRSIPDFLSLVGAEVAFQWLLPTNNTSLLPFILSNAGAVQVGSNL